MELNLEIIKAIKLLEENGYKVVKSDSDICPDCGCVGYHFCTGKKRDTATYNDFIRVYTELKYITPRNP
jgi:hypothetical protein